MLKLNQFKISVFKILQVKHLRLEIFLTFFKAFRVFQVHFLKKVFLKKKLCVATTNYNMMFILCYFKKTKLGFFQFYLVKQRPKFYHIKENGSGISVLVDGTFFICQPLIGQFLTWIKRSNCWLIYLVLQVYISPGF